MSWFSEQLINYCERTDFSFWSEPANALSNIAFFIAACALHKICKQQNIRDRAVRILTVIIGIVGLGSFLFHTLATKLAMLSDIIPIVCFVAYYIYVSFTRLLGWKPISALLLVALFIGFGGYADNLSPPYNLNGSIAYLPCLAVIIYIGSKLRERDAQVAKLFGSAALFFAVSLTFRTIDMQICTDAHFGTHFLWHCCNGIVLYLLVKALIQSRKPAN